MRNFRSSPLRDAKIPATSDSARETVGPDITTSVVRVYSRLDADRGWLDGKKLGPGVSYLWILQDEVKQMLGTAPSPDKSLRLPPAMLARLITCHIVDHQAGDALVWKPTEIRKCDFRAFVVREDEVSRTLGFEGQLRMETADETWFGISGQLVGEITLSRKTVRVDGFRAYFEGLEGGAVSEKRGDTLDDTAAKRPPSVLRIAMKEAKPDDSIANGTAPVLGTSREQYRKPTMTEQWLRRYGRIDTLSTP